MSLVLELWKVNRHEGLASARMISEGVVLPPVNDLSPGTYFVCDASGNRAKVTIEDYRGKDDCGVLLGEPVSEEVAHGTGGG